MINMFQLIKREYLLLKKSRSVFKNNLKIFMKYVAAYALLVLGGKQNPTEDDIKGLLKEIGAEIQENEVKELVKALHGKNLQDVIAEGMKKVGTLSVGGGGAAPAPQQAAQTAAKEAPKEVPKEAPKPAEDEVDMDMGGLFD